MIRILVFLVISYHCNWILSQELGSYHNKKNDLKFTILPEEKIEFIVNSLGRKDTLTTSYSRMKMDEFKIHLFNYSYNLKEDSLCKDTLRIIDNADLFFSNFSLNGQEIITKFGKIEPKCRTQELTISKLYLDSLIQIMVFIDLNKCYTINVDIQDLGFDKTKFSSFKMRGKKIILNKVKYRKD